MTGVGGEDELQRDLDLWYRRTRTRSRTRRHGSAWSPSRRGCAPSSSTSTTGRRQRGRGVPDVLKALQEAGVRTVGYVDTGLRPPSRAAGRGGRRGVAGPVRRPGGVPRPGRPPGWTCSTSTPTSPSPARARGADYVVSTPARSRIPGYVDLANITITFEGPWRDYRRLAEPEWVRALPDVPVRPPRPRGGRTRGAGGLFRRAGRHTSGPSTPPPAAATTRGA
jgi:hypothetical protein